VLRIATGIRDLFIQKEKRKMRLVDIIEFIQEKTNGAFLSSDEIKKMVSELTKILPKWINIIVIPKNTLVQVSSNPKYSHGFIREAVTKYFKK